jgi:hypothetical protein
MLEPTIYPTLGGHANYYTPDAVSLLSDFLYRLLFHKIDNGF